jgi:hypothetical protein
MPASRYRPGALALGAAFALGTCYVLLGDVREPSQVTADHAAALLVLAGTIAAGHLFGREARSLRLLRASGLALLFACGTFYCVTSSAARQAEAPAAREAGAKASNDARRRLEADLAEAKGELLRARADAASECASGDGSRCRGRRATAEAAQARYEAARAADAASIEAALSLLFPFAKACFLEVAAILFLGIGLGEGRKAGESVGESERGVGDGEESAGEPWSRDRALADLLSMLQRGVSMDQRLLARRWGRSDSCVSKWMREFEAGGLVSRVRDGRSRRASA